MLRERADNIVYTPKGLTPYPLAERTLVPQLYVLSKYTLYTMTLGDRAQETKCVHTKMLNPLPQLATLQAASEYFKTLLPSRNSS